MSGTRTWMETVRALTVLALVFLNFAHQPAFAAPMPGDSVTVLASQSFCGEPVGDDSDHAPCNACRIGSGADLPPVTDIPCSPVPAAIRLGAVPAAFVIAPHDPGPAGPRGPPLH